MSDPIDNEQSGSTRRKMLSLLGGGAAASLAGCSAFLGGDDDGGEDLTYDGPGTDPTVYADKAQEAWETVENNPDPDAQETRNQAFVEIEQAARDSAILLNFMHDIGERFWYDHVDVPKYGALGPSYQQHNRTTLSEGSELNLMNSTHNYIDPIESDDEASSMVITQIYETLVNYPDGVAEVNNKLIDGFEISDDGKTYTFNLKQGVQFHGGEELTAQDVKYSWRRVVESENSVRANFMLSSATGVGAVHETDDDGNVVADSLGVTVVDDYTLELEIVNANPSVLDVLTYTAFSIVPEGIVGDIDGYDGEVSHDEFRQNMANGTGPFQFDSFELDEELRVTKFDDYHGKVAEVDSIHYAIIEGTEATYTYAVSEKNADIFGLPTQYYSPDAVDAEEDDRGRKEGTYGPADDIDEEVNYLGVPELVTRYFGFNARNVPIEVRQAFAYVMNQEEIVNELFAGRGVPAYSFTPRGIWPTGQDGYEEFADNYPFSPNETDLDGAKAVLQEADKEYSEDNPFKITATTYDSKTYEKAVGQLRDKLAGNGIEVEIDPAGFSVLQERGYNGKLEMYTLGWGWSWQSVAYGHFGFEPKNTDTSKMPEETNGYYLDWQTELSENQ